MAKQKERSETEHLRGRVRELEALVKQLLKKANRSTKKSDRLEALIDEKEEAANLEVAAEFAALAEKRIPRCPACASKEFDQFVIGNRILEICDGCGHRKTVVAKS